jgi:hypothetical protein
MTDVTDVRVCFPRFYDPDSQRGGNSCLKLELAVMLIGHLALVVASLFSGAAFYVYFAEQPARLQLDDKGLLTE